MLVVTRKVDESLRIGDSITITIVRVQGDQVRVGIDAPKHVQVLRDDAKRTVPVERIP